MDAVFAEPDETTSGTHEEGSKKLTRTVIKAKGGKNCFIANLPEQKKNRLETVHFKTISVCLLPNGV